MLRRLWRGLRRASPVDAEAAYRLAVDCHGSREYASVVALLESVVNQQPVHAEACNLLGLVFAREFARFEDGETLVRRALSARPDWDAARTNLGWILTESGKDKEGFACLDEVLARHPDDHEARLMRAAANLKRGDFAAGWPDYEARHASATAVARPYSYPAWDGGACPGETILVFAEQGLGDQIMFASCLRDAEQRGGQLLLECHPRLLSLFRRSFPGMVVGASGSAAAGWLEGRSVDRQIPIGSLPRLFRGARDSFPRHNGYLRADPERIAYWKRRIERLGPGLAVGLSWRGGTATSRSSIRSIPPEQLAPLLRQPVHFIDLQYGESGPERAAMHASSGVEIVHWPEALADYDETAALIMALDLVISVCTAAIHLAGALGQQVWVLAPAVTEWRYLRSGEQMPWYPSVRLLRQQQAFDWGDLIMRVSGELGSVTLNASR